MVVARLTHRDSGFLCGWGGCRFMGGDSGLAEATPGLTDTVEIAPQTVPVWPSGKARGTSV